MISHIHIKRDFETEKFHGNGGLEWTPKLLKAFSRDYFYVKPMRHSKFQLGQFFVH